ncbi:Scavenger mRNA decapping enzyme C-term binding [Trinickia caryophylli]|uniref:Scavenger mRNA decapping enzyme C-term binding n=2 Tax=Trinickia caryophylli TaxID=28094 RepID=A0A1X7H4H1_TRICW|nr:Scavenger mRNA decapping enzyme C-term binding [Trinickia caryophylli]
MVPPLTEARDRQAPTIDVSAARNIQVGPNQEGRSAIHGTLNAYGIDDNREKLSAVNKDAYNVFVKKDGSGKSDLAHGAYVSKRGDDEYGSFRWLNPRSLKKYQTNDLAQVKLSSRHLDALRETYKNENATQFLVDVLRGQKLGDTVYGEVFKKNPEAFYYSAPMDRGNGFLIYPNIPYMSENYVNGNISNLTQRREGVQLTAWAVHPALPHDLIDEISGNKSAAEEQAPRSEELNQKSAEIKSGIKSLTSILDLDGGDVAMLEKLKSDILDHLSEVYGASDQKDKINLFFHFPVATSTATLHLHVWVNKADHPLNESREFGVDDVIRHLKSGQSIDSLVLARNDGKFTLPTRDGLHEIKGMPERGAPAPDDYRKLALPGV